MAEFYNPTILKLVRNACKVSQQELANHSGVTRASIASQETRRRRLDSWNLMRLWDSLKELAPNEELKNTCRSMARSAAAVALGRSGEERVREAQGRLAKALRDLEGEIASCVRDTDLRERIEKGPAIEWTNFGDEDAPFSYAVESHEDWVNRITQEMIALAAKKSKQRAK